MCTEQALVTLCFSFGVARVAAQVVELLDWQLGGDTLAHVALEARRMHRSETDVLVHMERAHARPIDPARLDELGEEGQLRIPSCEHDVRLTARVDRGSERVGGLGRGATGEFNDVVGNHDRQEINTEEARTHANCGSQREVAASISSVICSRWSKSVRPASGSNSIASTTLLRSPVSPASTVVSCDAMIRRSQWVSRFGACASLRTWSPSPSAVHIDSTTTSSGRSGHWPRFGKFSGK